MVLGDFWKKPSGVGGGGSVVPMVPYGSPMGPVGALWGPAVGVGGMGAARCMRKLN